MRKLLAKHFRLLGVVVLIALTAAASLALNGYYQAARVAPGRPRLFVLVVFDQLRGDYLQRWQELFGPDGFRRLQQEGAWFSNCHYPYAHTVTAAGHASLMTGCSPDRHGIVGNEWYDRDAGTPVSCVGSERHIPVPRPTGAGRGVEGVAPDRLLAPTFGDALRAALPDQSKVIGLSLKDRGAVLPAGRRANACYWYDSDTGRVGTSTYYMDRLPTWVAAFNDARWADRWFGKDWLRMRPDVDYVRYSGPDDGAGEGTGFKQGRTFPHLMTGGLQAPGKEFYRAVYNSPFGNDLLMELARRAIDGEQLGAPGRTDLLCISFSANDAIGHTWGPDSQEVLDVTLRADAVMRDLLAHLDARVGRGQYVVAVTADHGVCPLPEISQAEGRPAGRSSMPQLAVEAEEFLCSRYSPVGGVARWFEEGRLAPWLYLNYKVLRELKLDQAEVERSLVGWLENQPGVARAYTRSEFSWPRPSGKEGLFWKDFYPARSGDIRVALKPYWIWAVPFLGGTNHGSPHPYDTHVPLLIYGPGIPAGVRTDQVTPQTLAAVFAQLVGIAPPAAAEAPVPPHFLAP